MACRLSRSAALALLGSVAISACGTKAPVVATVQGRAISLSALNHWIAIKRAELQGSHLSSAEVKRKALAFLITADWLQQEAAADGISVSASEINASYAQLLSGPAGPSFATSLKRRGISSADERLLLRLGVLGQKLRAKIVHHRDSLLQARGRQQLVAFIAAYRQRWKRRTTCQARYVIAECRNGPPLPAETSTPRTE